MSRKDFRAIAEAIRQIPHIECRRIAANNLAVVCRASNARFDPIRFYKACGL